MAPHDANTHATPRPDLIPVEDLFAPPAHSKVVLSPDGTRIAYLAPWRDRLNVWVRDLGPVDGVDGEPRRVTADESRSILSFAWTADSQGLLYAQDEGGDENFHLFRVDVDAPDNPAVDLTPYPGARVLTWEQPVARPGTVLLQINHRRVEEIDLAELDVATGELRVLAENPGRASGWVLPADGRPVAQVLGADGTIVVTRWNDGVPETIAEYSGHDHLLGLVPGELSADGSGLWFGSYTGSDRMRLARLDLDTGAETEVDSHPEMDLDALRRAVWQGVRQTASALIRHPRTGTLLGVRYLGQRQVIHPLDPHFADVLAQVEQLSDGDIEDISTDHSGTRWVVSVTHDRDPNHTWYYDHITGGSRELFGDDPRPDPAVLAPMTPVTITARDGLRLPSYLTLPVGTEPAGLPMVLLVHGGPWHRDAWGFDPQVQLLANRGYAVLQVNFRGSVGYGNAHTQAAVGEFAGAMHDDLIDAVEWAVAAGYADPQRIGIVGESYGGYATLVGITVTPNVFAAAVDSVGISDLASFMRTIPPFVRGLQANLWGRYVGDPDVPEQAADMAARSPIHHVDRIRTPLLIAQGANDTRVVRAESDTIVAALHQRGVEVEYLVKDDEGHVFVNPQNQIDVHRATERFLARHLGGAATDT